MDYGKVKAASSGDKIHLLNNQGIAMPKIFPFRGIRGRLILLLLIVLVPVLLVEVYISYERFKIRRSEEFQANLEVARAVAKNFTTFVQDTVQNELNLGLAITGTQPISARKQNHLLDKFRADSPTVRDVVWINPQGITVAANSSGGIGIGTSVKDQRYFQEIAAGRDWSISELIEYKATRKTAFTINRAIRNARGKLLGVVSAFFVPDRLDSVLGIDRSKGGNVSLIDNKGMLVYRYPFTEQTVEQRSRLRDNPIIAYSLKGKEALTSVVAELTGKKRLVALTPVSSIGWVAAASRGEAEVMKPITSSLLFQAGLVFFVTLVGFGVAVAFSRPISNSIIRLRNHALALGRGEREDVIPISGPDELKDLARAFNQMTGEVQSREAAIRESEQRWVTTLASIGDAVIAADVTGKITFINKVAQKLTGWTVSEALSKPLSEIFHLINEQTRQQIEDPVVNVIKEGSIVGFANHTLLLGKSGSEILVAASGAPIQDKQGKVRGVVLIFRDITERKQAEDALRQSETRSKLLSQTASQLLASASPEKIIADLCRPIMEHLDCQVSFNFLEDEGAGRLHLNAYAGISEEEARTIEFSDYGVAVCGCVARERRPIVAEDIDNIADPRTDLVKSFGIQAYACHPLIADGRFFGTLSFGTKTRAHISLQDLAFMKIMSDRVAIALDRVRVIRELQRSHEELEIRVQERTRELQQSKQQLQHLSSQLMSAQEAERKRIAAELHDSICSSLAGIKIRLEQKLSQMNEGFSPPGVRLEDIIDTVGHCNEETRKIMNNLRPGMLDDLGLLPTIDWYCREFKNINPHLTIQKEIHLSEEDLTEPIKIVIYRVMQEVLNNAAKHSGADMILISLIKEESQIKMVIQDNGQGFDLEKVLSERRGMGLINMRERVQFAGGFYSLNSRKGEGTTMYASWPINPPGY